MSFSNLEKREGKKRRKELKNASAQEDQEKDVWTIADFRNLNEELDVIKKSLANAGVSDPVLLDFLEFLFGFSLP